MKKVIVYQEEISDCGVACLLSIIRHYKGDANLETLRIDSNTTNKGVTAYNLIECAKKNGFNAIGYKDYNVTNYKLPCILHFQINQSLSHFVVLYSISNNKYKVMDPAKGFITLNEKELKKMFTGYIISLEPLTSLPQKKNEDIVKKKIIHELKSNKNSITKVILLNIVFIILSIINSFYIKIYNYENLIIILSLIFLVLNIIIIIVSNLIYRRIYNLEDKINYNLADNFFNHIISLPLKYLHLKDPGEIVKRSNEVDLINNIILNSVISLLLNILILLSIFPILIVMSPSVTIFIITTITLLLFVSVISIDKMKTKSREAIDASTEYNNILIDGIYGLTSIKHSRSEEYLKKRLMTCLKTKLLKDKNYNFQLKNNEIVRTIFLSLLRVIINLYLINKVYNQEFTFESLIIINLLIEIIINSCSSIISTIIEVIFVKNLFHKANDFYNIPDISRKCEHAFIPGEIKFKNITYNYTNHPLIKNFTTTIKLGEKVIIKGESGTGKSTLCKIIYREIEDYKGEILINNQNIKKIDLNDYRNNIIYSSQTEKIFSGSIRDNILLGKNINISQLNNIIEICELNRIIKKHTFGLDTLLFSGGEELSGGERQLIILARALVNNFSILILDETLSEVNDEVENRILENIFKFYKDKTIIYVSHKNKKNYFKRVINV